MFDGARKRASYWSNEIRTPDLCSYVLYCLGEFQISKVQNFEYSAPSGMLLCVSRYVVADVSNKTLTVMLRVKQYDI